MEMVQVQVPLNCTEAGCSWMCLRCVLWTEVSAWVKAGSVSTRANNTPYLAALSYEYANRKGMRRILFVRISLLPTVWSLTSLMTEQPSTLFMVIVNVSLMWMWENLNGFDAPPTFFSGDTIRENFFRLYTGSLTISLSDCPHRYVLAALWGLPQCSLRANFKYVFFFWNGKTTIFLLGTALDFQTCLKYSTISFY